jgi:hypothetical protein
MMTDESRSRLCTLMTQELIFHALLHDLRGNATTLMGWQSLLKDQNAKAVAGLGRSVDGLTETIQHFAGAPEAGWPETSAVIEDVAERLGIGFEGESFPVEIAEGRLEAACWLSGAQGLSIKRLPEKRAEIRLVGLQKEGLRLLFSPQSVEILSAAREPSPTLGTCLFKEVVRGVRGDYVSDVDSGVLCLLVPLGSPA